MKSPLLPPNSFVALALTGAIGLSLAPLPFSPAIAVAQGGPITQTPPDRGAPGGRSGGGGTYYKPPTPPSTGAPEGRPRGGASRNLCPKAEFPLTALVPTEKPFTPGSSAVVPFWALTTAEKPTLWFYMPYTQAMTLKTPIRAEFVLQDRDRNRLYSTSVALPKEAGVIAVRLPDTAPVLKADQLYQWRLKINCGSQKTSVPISVDGWIQRTSLDPTLAKQIATAKPKEQVTLYANNGIWHDALSVLADLRLATPTDPALLDLWNALLSDSTVNLKDIADKPLVKGE